MRSIYKIIFSLTIAGLLSLPSTALEDIKIENGQVLGLNDCIKIALQNNPSIKNAGYNYGISKANVGIAKSAYFPTIGVGTGYDYTTTHTKRYSGNNDIYDVSASINQLIWNFGRTNARIRMEKFYMIADEYNFANTVRETTFNVKQRYYEVLAARSTVLVNEAYVDINERNYQRTKAYYDEGLKSKIDLVNAEVTLSDSKITLIKSENAYKNSLVNLNNAMYLENAPVYNIEGGQELNIKDNVAPVDLSHIQKTTDKESYDIPVSVNDAKLTSFVEKLELLTDYKIDPFPYNFDECLELAYKNRDDLKAYTSIADAVKENLTYVKRNYYPQISANAGYGFRDENRTNSLNIGVNVSSSLNIMGQKNEVDAAKYQLEIAKNNLNQLKQDIYFQVQNAYINMIELEKQLPLQGVKVRQTLENYELAEGRYYVGLGDYIELQDAKVNYNNAQTSYIETIYRYNVARANLESVIALEQEVSITLKDMKNESK